jgi:ribosomal protein L14E/L6E/L27E
MKSEPLEVGRVVLSLSGRDAGRMFAVVKELDEAYVCVADGDLRKIERPKKKKRKHLKGTKHVLNELREALLLERPVLNAEIRKALAAESMQKEGADVEI